MANPSDPPGSSPPQRATRLRTRRWDSAPDSRDSHLHTRSPAQPIRPTSQLPLRTGCEPGSAGVAPEDLLALVASAGTVGWAFRSFQGGPMPPNTVSAIALEAVLAWIGLLGGALAWFSS